ncbi:phytanoyl-CoA dioxygenase family protein [Curvivirga sp.]|uniref:phytanoyl-CoA dioxygenase family protein n=1 Tax=Curvivirga sp. TaxID=2856848 RepID=UPI003B5CE636
MNRKITSVTTKYSDLSNIYVDAGASDDEVLKRIQVYGAVVIKDFCPKEQLKSLDQDYWTVVDAEEKDRSKYVNAVIEFPGSTVMSVLDYKVTAENLPTFHKIFWSEYMRSIAAKYFSPLKVSLNNTVYVTNDTSNPDQKHITDWHFDQLHSLKFYLYLEDTNEDNGALQIIPGSHHEAFSRSNCGLMSGLEYFDNKIPEEQVVNAVNLNAQAGDLIIFDTNCFHRGGRIEPNKIRRVIRGHSHAIRDYNFKERMIMRWSKSRLNVFRRLENVKVVGRHVNPEYASQQSSTSEVSVDTSTKRY